MAEVAFLAVEGEAASKAVEGAANFAFKTAGLRPWTKLGPKRDEVLAKLMCQGKAFSRSIPMTCI